jgi:hypothetical protein
MLVRRFLRWTAVQDAGLKELAGLKGLLSAELLGQLEDPGFETHRRRSCDKTALTFLKK